ncbi:MAG: T9SS type A sorting domain-containing protein, partial [Salinivenus sp.]
LRLKETYPNPARQRVTVRFAVPEGQAGEGEATLRLYDVLGREVRSAAPGAEAGRHETQLSVEGLASGTYFLRLTAGGQAVARKLTVVR